MRYFLLVLLLFDIGLAQTLTLEFAQEGDPSHPRALILVHNVMEDRSSFKSILEAWDDRSWARDQYCSVYTFEYRSGGTRDLVSSEELAKNLYSKIQADRFKEGRSDEVNSNARPDPSDERQPSPTLKDEKVELLFVGFGYGGLVVRDTVRLAKLRGRKVERVSLVGSPLDGLSHIDLILGFTVPERARSLGLSNPVATQELNSLSESWWRLSEYFEDSDSWASYFAPILQDTQFFGGAGSQTLPYHPTENVLYGRHKKIVSDAQASDGFLPTPVTWGKETGPISWVKETTLPQTPFSALTENGAATVLALPEQAIVHGYLAQREGIEAVIKGDGELPPIGRYWDERYNRWMEAYASKRGLYQMMWGVL